MPRSSFNEAAARWPRKAAGPALDGAEVHGASTRPRRDGRGRMRARGTSNLSEPSFNEAAARWPRKAVICPTVSTPITSLQRGRGAMAAEGIRARAQIDRNVRASTRPRRDGRGRGSDLDDDRAGQLASTRPRRDGRGRLFGAFNARMQTFRLQRGRGAMAAEGQSSEFSPMTRQKLQRGRGAMAAEGRRSA